MVAKDACGCIVLAIEVVDKIGACGDVIGEGGDCSGSCDVIADGRGNEEAVCAADGPLPWCVQGSKGDMESSHTSPFGSKVSSGTQSI